MKPGPESAAAKRAPEQEEFVNRKLIRPSLSPVLAKAQAETAAVTSGANGSAAAAVRARKPARKDPPRNAPAADSTNAENFYYNKQIQSRTPMTVSLKTGEVMQGIIEWYDKACIKLHRPGKGNVLIYKHAIRYMQKSDE